MLEKYKVILFDLDDTLLDFQKAEQRAFMKVCQDNNLTYDNELFDSYKAINKSLWKKYEEGEISNSEVVATRFELFFKEVGKDIDGKKTDEMYRNYLAEGDQLFDGVYNLLEILSKSHVLCIASNGIGKTQHTRLINNNIKKFFDYIFISEEIGSKKPERQFFETIFNKLENYSKEQILMVGDNINADIKGADSFGIDSCLVLDKNIEQNDIIPTYTVKKVVDIINL